MNNGIFSFDSIKEKTELLVQNQTIKVMKKSLDIIEF